MYALERRLRPASGAHSRTATSRSQSRLASPGCQSEALEHVAEFEPFETGQLVLSSTGNLHLLPQATFYRPAYVIPEWQHTLTALISRSTPLPGYLAPYLPLPMAETHHAILIDLAFDRLLSFGPNPFRDQFVSAMNVDPDMRGLYFSPLLHLCILGVGWRYNRDPNLAALYYPNVERIQHGDMFIERAKEMVLAEANAAHLSTIWSLFVMTLFYVGQSKE